MSIIQFCHATKLIELLCFGFTSNGNYVIANGVLRDFKESVMYFQGKRHVVAYWVTALLCAVSSTCYINETEMVQTKILALNCLTSFIEETSGPNTLSQNESYILYHELLFWWILSLLFITNYDPCYLHRADIQEHVDAGNIYNMIVSNVYCECFPAHGVSKSHLSIPSNVLRCGCFTLQRGTFLQMFCGVDVSRSKEAHSFKCFVLWMFHAPKRRKTRKSFGPSARCQPPLTHGPQSLRASPIVFERAH